MPIDDPLSDSGSALPGTQTDTPGAKRRGLLSDDLPLPLPHTRVTSKLTDVQKHAGPLLTSELIDK